MATNAAQKIQDRIFGKGAALKPDDQAQPFPQTQDRVDPPTPLIINIPKSQATSTQPPKKSNPDSSPREDGEEADATTPPVRPYRERLAEKLKNDYKGTEKYRLEQDDKREKHWKRWGPYLSDRQWVSLTVDRSHRASFNSFPPRPLSERITLPMVMLGVTSLTLMPDPGHIDGVKMVSLESPTTTNVFALDCLFGMVRIPSSRNAFLVLLAIKETTART